MQLMMKQFGNNKKTFRDQNVAQKASELGRQQNPMLSGDPDKILMSYRQLVMVQVWFKFQSLGE